ncbi:P-loop containing nucleoside triphosphate hydrolase protein [Thelephora ganbajun]|uniref:P-loop containing nucleoside triphosphate hydrolase protein n=1 Tax=Thelephora ganbajun TaxID=370292 RepID=A0ACB6ZL28_THEGA|nr:P-loop containing nucleoside triphosphate hydrolase protein [Thelephora ganbajun]
MPCNPLPPEAAQLSTGCIIHQSKIDGYVQFHASRLLHVGCASATQWRWSEKRAADDDDCAQRKSDLAKEFSHTKAGIWDVYEQIPTTKFGINIPVLLKLSRNLEIIQDLPFVWRMLKDVLKIKSCRYYLCLFIFVKTLASLQPAVALWFTSHYLTIIQLAMDERRLDEKLLIFASIGRMCCAIAETFLDSWEEKLQIPLDLLIKEHFDKEIFSVSVDLDVPTYNDKIVKRRLDGVSAGSDGGSSIAWESISVILSLFSSVTRLVTELGVLAKVAGSQQDGVYFTTVHLGQELSRLILAPDWSLSRTYAWVAITSNEHYVKLAGLERLVSRSRHKEEVVAGNLAESLKAAYNQAYGHVSGKCASHYDILSHSRSNGLRSMASTLLPKSAGEVAEVAYLLKSAARPETIPACLATINLIQTTNQSFTSALLMTSYQAKSIGEQFHKIRQLYEIHEIQNKVPDGIISFPEDSRSLVSGITVEFRNVSFRYPDSDDFALRDVSFKVEKGQLCVIVGTNGSGKSTVLKLMLRLYDPTEGMILINGHDIKTLKLSDLRESMAVLFQEYTHFPLTIKDNIALGDSRNAHDEDRIREAARLGGAEEFIDKMARGFDTYLERPVRDVWSIPSNAKTKSGVKIDRDLIREVIGRAGHKDSIKLSGGQMQRLAVSRMFMRAVLSEEARVGLLLFDEPSAALDPTAEHDLFTRIRKLRGEKTMIFSSHRFGRLTRPADLILYMNDSTILECGTHNELMAKGGKYSELWNLQAQAFL